VAVEVKGLYNRTSFRQLDAIVWRGCELFLGFSSEPSGWSTMVVDRGVLREMSVSALWRNGFTPKSLSTNNIISSSLIKMGLILIISNHRCNSLLISVSSSSVPAPADVRGGGKAGTKHSGFA